MESTSLRTLSLTVRPDWEGREVKRLLTGVLHMAEGHIAALKLRPAGICLNGERVFTNARVRKGDILTVQIGDWDGRNDAAPIAVPLDFVYEDEDLAVLNKSADMAVHGSASGTQPTVANALAARWGQRQAFHPVNRLDRGTSGLMVIAKSAYVHELLRRQLHTDAFVREYLALAAGRFNPPDGRIELPIAKAQNHPTAQEIRADGKPSVTEYHTLEAFSDCSLLRLRALTGRTHQLRLHCAALGHPLLGDRLYGGDDRLPRPALHSAYLRLRHPVSGELLTLSAPLPRDMAALKTRPHNPPSATPGKRDDLFVPP